MRCKARKRSLVLLRRAVAMHSPAEQYCASAHTVGTKSNAPMLPEKYKMPFRKHAPVVVVAVC